MYGYVVTYTCTQLCTAIYTHTVSETIRNINILLGSLVTKSNAQLRELQSLSEELSCLKESVKSLNDSVTGLKVSMASLNHLEMNVNDQMAGLNDSVRSLREQLTEHKQQTATTDNITQQMIQHINTLLGSVGSISNTQLIELQSMSQEQSYLKDSVTGLNDSVRSLHEQLTEHKEQTATTDTITQQMNTKLNTLISGLSQHQQQTAAESAQFQTSLTQLHQNLTNNLTHQLETIQYYLESDPSLPMHTCGGTGGWKRVVYLDMTDPSTTCPSGWNMTGHSKRTCGKVSTGHRACDSVTFPVSGGEYSRVCGRIKAYQHGHIDAFEAYHDGHVTTIDGAYVAGVSLTHGSPRRHIWTFAAGASEAGRTWVDACPCDASITIRVPPFVGDDYFCESGVNARAVGGFYPDDPLWDGLNCTSSSTCCSFNSPPYFVKQLPTSTTDDIEARLCRFNAREDSPVELIELYMQ